MSEIKCVVDLDGLNSDVCDLQAFLLDDFSLCLRCNFLKKALFDSFFSHMGSSQVS